MLHSYPYSDCHELNLDYILEEMNQLDLDIKGIEDRASEIATESAKKYVDAQLISIKADMTTLRNDLTAGIRDVYEVRNSLNSQYSSFTTDMNARFNLLQQRVTDVENHIDSAVIGCNARTDIVVNQMHDQIMSEISAGLVSENVINYFTGEIMTVQQMLDYLCRTFHGSNGASINYIVNTKQWTVNSMVALDHSISDWVVSGGTY